MNFKQIGFESVWVANLDVFTDHRGYFYELYSETEKSSKLPIGFKPKQSNFSLSTKGALRGIHFSLVPDGQIKWLTCVSGSILDCVVDLREGSPTFGGHQLIEISAAEPQALLIGKGIGHAFLSLEENTIVNYLLSSPYDPKFEFAINPLDQTIRIEWPTSELILSEKDRTAVTLKEASVLKKLPQYTSKAI
jgi:dTDP-4-dehydrorhamnose 3,5-epimerase